MSECNRISHRGVFVPEITNDGHWIKQPFYLVCAADRKSQARRSPSIKSPVSEPVCQRNNRASRTLDTVCPKRTTLLSYRTIALFVQHAMIRAASETWVHLSLPLSLRSVSTLLSKKRLLTYLPTYLPTESLFLSLSRRQESKFDVATPPRLFTCCCTMTTRRGT